ncbi:MAG: type II secretion system protein GspF [Desulfobulbaceae bacterium S3730MH12]|nr:MAG: type II secretion system protein GspF [Desulfobulbaceae bacterium S5133MH15]OEU58468.1 MAG: type II secretion system protein GspF [Desulfobulbaceae bacterium S3730MH12]
MPVYEYKALDKKGKNIKGILDATSESQARSKLRTSGQYLVSIRESRSRSGPTGKKVGGIGLFERVKPEEISVMTRQLATLLGAAIPLVQALNSLVDQTRNSTLKKVIAQIKESVNEGNTLTQAIGEHPKLFSSIYVNMVRAGEASGSLDVVLEKLADFAEKQEALKGRLRAALIYPIFMAFIGTAILFVLITYIVPNITQVFNEMDKVLPGPTLFLLGLSDFLKRYWWGLLIGAAGAVIGIRWFVEKPYGRNLWDLVKLKSPVIGPVIRKVILARFASTLGSLLGSGVELMTAMKIVRTLVNNVHVGRVIDEAMVQIQKGENMADSLSSSEWFPPMFVQMIAVGEQSGNLEVMLKKVAKAYEREVETAIMGMTSLIEPIMIVAMGAAVGFVVLSILLPIFEMNQMIG